MKATWMRGLLLAAVALLGCGRSHAQTGPALTPAAIDRQIQEAWQAQHIQPSPPVDDARFLRRAYLDILGTVPPPNVVTAFLADQSPDKRAKLVDTLLDNPRYANHWTDYWDYTLMGPVKNGLQVNRYAFRQWLREQFLQNTPWNKFVTELITARGETLLNGDLARGISMTETRKGASP
ncbi:MAG TPA: DUF1549 domain-containing protein, partial [Chthonomonadaceae bacterium]|nr:DUF1549 domain-containing protein [Chthonomonadaceae bacterium]